MILWVKSRDSVNAQLSEVVDLRARSANIEQQHIQLLNMPSFYDTVAMSTPVYTFISGVIE